jgi:altronate dehydratase
MCASSLMRSATSAPFFGQAAVAYIPQGRVIGLSKIPRIVDRISLASAKFFVPSGGA